MKKKKILFSSYLHGNMEALIDYYNKNINKHEYDIVYLDLSLIEKKSKIPRYIRKFMEFHKKYNLVLSDYASPILGTGENAIFMDHGYGLKTMPGKDDLKIPRTREIIELVQNKVDYIVTLSERDEKYFYNAPGQIGKPCYLPLGQPRNDVLFHKEFISSSREDIRNKLNIKTGDKILLYAPTWRGYDASESYPFNREDFQQLNEYLGKNKWKLLYRPHYMEKLVKEEMIKDLNNILLCGINVEPYTQKLLAACDFVVTDYSSIVIDFLILDKPVAFIPFDENKYDGYRGLVVDFNNLTHIPGPKINKMSQLIDYLKKIDNNKDEYSEHRKNAIKYYYTYFDDNSCSRIWELIIKTLNEIS